MPNEIVVEFIFEVDDEAPQARELPDSTQKENRIRDFNFLPGRLVLVRNSAEDSGLKNKYRPRYLGPYVVVRRNQGGAYMLSEMDGTVSKLRFAARRLIPYHLRSAIRLPIPNEDLQNANNRVAVASN